MTVKTKYYKHQSFERASVKTNLGIRWEDVKGKPTPVNTDIDLDVTVLVDIDAIVKQLARKAYYTRQGKSSYLHGAVIVKARKST